MERDSSFFIDTSPCEILAAQQKGSARITFPYNVLSCRSDGAIVADTVNRILEIVLSAIARRRHHQFDRRNGDATNLAQAHTPVFPLLCN